jgi:hypothetical protein
MEADTTVHTKNLKSSLIQLRYCEAFKTWCHDSHYTHVIRQIANLQWWQRGKAGISQQVKRRNKAKLDDVIFNKQMFHRPTQLLGFQLKRNN